MHQGQRGTIRNARLGAGDGRPDPRWINERPTRGDATASGPTRQWSTGPWPACRPHHLISGTGRPGDNGSGDGTARPHRSRRGPRRTRLRTPRRDWRERRSGQLPPERAAMPGCPARSNAANTVRHRITASADPFSATTLGRNRGLPGVTPGQPRVPDRTAGSAGFREFLH